MSSPEEIGKAIQKQRRAQKITQKEFAQHLGKSEMDYEAAVGDSVISEQDEVYIPPETNEMPEADIDVAENVISDANEMAKEITE